MKPQTLRIVLTLAIFFDWSIQKIYVNNVFLNDDIKDVVYMDSPLDFVDALGFVSCKCNSSMPYSPISTHMKILLVYVDDIIITQNDTSYI